MSDGRLTTYVAFGGAIAAVIALGIGFSSTKTMTETASISSDVTMPDMKDVPKMEPVAQAASVGAMDKKAIRAEIRDYILSEPEIILEAFQLLEDKRTLEEAQTDIDLVKDNAEPLFDDGFSFVGGNPEGSITLVEFQDYRCGYCKRAHGEVQELVAEDGDIRLVVKEFPILGPDSMTVSELAIATLMTQGDKAYKRFSDALMTYSGPVNDKTIERLAKGALVDIAQTRAGLDDPEVKKRIAATRALGGTMKITGTPTFVIGDKIIRGYIPKDQMAEVVALSRRVNQ